MESTTPQPAQLQYGWANTTSGKRRSEIRNIDSWGIEESFPYI